MQWQCRCSVPHDAGTVALIVLKDAFFANLYIKHLLTIIVKAIDFKALKKYMCVTRQAPRGRRAVQLCSPRKARQNKTAPENIQVTPAMV